MSRRLPFTEVAEIRLIFFVNSPSVCWELAHVLVPHGSGSSFLFLVIKLAESYPAQPSPVAKCANILPSFFFVSIL